MTTIDCLDFENGRDWALYQGDAVEICRQLPERSIDLALYSPPFANLYCYSDSERDMGNCANDEEFFEQYRYLVIELFRMLRPGRVVAVHCKDLVNYKNRDGMAGLRDFPGDLVCVHTECGFAYHSRVTIWKCPVTEMQRTKAHGLLYRQLRRDSTFSRQGLAEYVLIFRKWAEEDKDDGYVVPVTHTEQSFTLDQWQEWASPVWMNIDQTNVLNVAAARDDADSKHMCVARGSLVLTYDGYRPIEEVAIGDRVLTHRGRWRRVLAKSKTGNRATVRTHAQGVADLRTTPDHRFWIRQGRTSHPRKVARSEPPQWAAAESTLGSYVGLALPPIEDSPLTEHEWWVVGRWLGDGHFDTRGRIHISCSHEELDGLLDRLGPLAGSVAKSRTCAQVSIKDRSRRLRSILQRCGRGASGKVLPGEALCLEQGRAEALLFGYLSADGHYVRKYDRWTASSVSRALVLGMAIVAQRARGVVASVYGGRKAAQTTIEGRIVNTKDDWILSIPPKNMSAMVLDDGGWKKVRRIEKTPLAEVWDLQVEEDESFVTEGCAVHNCPLQLDVIERCVKLWSNPGEVVFSPFAGVGSEGYGALKFGRKFVGTELKESYFRSAARNLNEASTVEQRSLFDAASL